MSGIAKLVAQVLYGSGLRLREGLNLRLKDLDFAQHQIIVRDTKGRESRVTPLPDALIEPLTLHLQTVKRWHEMDLNLGYGTVMLPYALDRKYPTQTISGFGNLSFLPRADAAMLVVVRLVAIICTHPVFRKCSSKQCR